MKDQIQITVTPETFHNALFDCHDLTFILNLGRAVAKQMTGEDVSVIGTPGLRDKENNYVFFFTKEGR